MKLEILFAKYGRAVTLVGDGDTREFEAMIQPLRYKNKMYLQGVSTRIGRNHQGYYLYLGPITHDLTRLGEGAHLEADGCAYEIDRAERVYLGREAQYVWAILRSGEGAFTD